MKKRKEMTLLNKIEKVFSIKYKRGNLPSSTYPTMITGYMLGIKYKINLHKNIFGINRSFIQNCDIEDLKYIKSKDTRFTHITGIVINKEVKLGQQCIIRQNVTIGEGKYNPTTQRCYPILGNRVDIGAGAIIIGGITIGDDVTIGAGTVVVKDIPDRAVVVGNPARIVRIKEIENQ